MVVGVSFTAVILPSLIFALSSEYFTDFVWVTLPLLLSSIFPKPSPSPTKALNIIMMTIEKRANANSGLLLKKLLLLLLS